MNLRPLLLSWLGALLFIAGVFTGLVSETTARLALTRSAIGWPSGQLQRTVSSVSRRTATSVARRVLGEVGYAKDDAFHPENGV